ncbi:Arc family DNA-binding protein [Mesorhizobium australicum]
MKIRLPRELKERIEASAVAANRSWNGEIVSRLEWSFAVGGLSLHRTEASDNDQSLREEIADLKSQLQSIQRKVGELNVRTEHLLPKPKTRYPLPTVKK